MAKFHRVSFVVLLAFLSVQQSFSSDLPAPSPSPQAADADAKSPSPASPAPSPALSASPPAPPMSSHAPGSSPYPSPSASPHASPSPSQLESPSPAPSEPADGGQKSDITAKNEPETSSGMSGGQKAAIALGVIAGVCLVGFGGILYRKRQHNVQRSQYGYAARRELL